MDDRTIGFYDSDPQGYSDTTFGNDVSASRDDFASRLPKGSKILDLGCGSGRDTLALMERGFDVTAVDGSSGMCAVAERNTGRPVRWLLFRDLDYVDEFDGVWACASLLHLPRRELAAVMGLVHRSLRHEGILFASFKKGDSEGFRDGRWYTDMTESSMEELAESTGFSVVDVRTETDARGVEWVSAILRKI